MVAPAPESPLSVDPQRLAGAIAELRASNEDLARSKELQEAWQSLLRATERVTVTCHAVHAREAKFADGVSTAVCTPGDRVEVRCPEYAGDVPVPLRALECGLARIGERVLSSLSEARVA
jgi:hypothetical protein